MNASPTLVVLGIAVAILYVFPIFSAGFTLALMIVVLAKIALAQDWNMFSGYSGYPLLGVAAFFGIGQYVTAYSANFLPYFAAVPLGGLLSAALAIPLGLVILRVRGTYFAILTFVLAEVLKFSFVGYEVANFASVGRILPTQTSVVVYYTILTITVLTIYLSHRIKNSRLGLGLLAIRNDEEVAEVMGVRTKLYKVSIFGLSACLMGLVGAAAVGRTGYVDPFSAFNPIISFEALVMAAFGGSGTVKGPVIGAIVLSILAEFLLGAYPLLYNLVLGTIIIITVILLPGGLLTTPKLLDRFR